MESDGRFSSGLSGIYFLFAIQVAGERVQALCPESLITRKPRGSIVHRLRQKGALYYSPFFRAANEPSILEHSQVFHKTSQRHAMGACEFGYWQAALGQRFQHGPTSGCGKRTEDGIEHITLILNH